jgi:hypothetical protein
MGAPCFLFSPSLSQVVCYLDINTLMPMKWKSWTIIRRQENYDLEAGKDMLLEEIKHAVKHTAKVA